MKIKKEEIPVTMESPGTTMRALPGYGGMMVALMSSRQALIFLHIT